MEDDLEDELIRLSDPDISELELQIAETVLRSSYLSQGPMVAAFERQFAAWLGRRHAVAVSGSTLAVWLCLKAWDISEEVVTTGHAWHQIARGISLAGAAPVFADIDYWAGTLDPNKAREKCTANTRAILAGNTNGHPADWNALRELARQNNLKLIEDCTESIGSRYAGEMAGTFGDCSIFDFSQPSALCCGECAMIACDDAELASRLRYLRDRQPGQRHSVSITSHLPLNARVPELTAALGIAQLKRLDEILAKRRQATLWYEDQMKSFEGIKPPYLAPNASEVNWFLYTVHLGTRFTQSSTRAIVDDLHTAGIEAEPYSYPLYLERYYIDRGLRKGTCFITEKVADRAVALPLHTRLTEEQVKFIVKTIKDASVNVGAGAAIY